MKSIIFYIFLSIIQSQTCNSSFIDNTVPRVDVEGNLIDVHDGNILKHEGKVILCNMELFIIVFK